MHVFTLSKKVLTKLVTGVATKMVLLSSPASVLFFSFLLLCTCTLSLVPDAMHRPLDTAGF